MDPFSAEGELLNIHNGFHQGDYTSVISFDTSSLSSSNKLPARILQLRAQIASGNSKAVLSSKDLGDTPDYTAVKALAKYSLGNRAEAVKEAEKLAQTQQENATVQLLVGTVLQAEGRTEEALELLSKHQGSLEAIALITQIHLQQNRSDLALKEVTAARKWAQDSLLVNIAESWVGLRLGGERYQSAFYVFEEMATAPSSTSSSTPAIKSLIGQAICELHLGRLPEAEAALQQALKDSEGACSLEAMANSLVLATIMGKANEAEELRAGLEREGKGREHPMLVDLREKGEAFDSAAAKYSAKVAG